MSIDFNTLEDNVNEMVENYVNGLTMTTVEKLGLDHRSGYRVFVSENELVVRQDDVRTLDYYGGFEYVDKDCRVEMGGYVIFRSDDDRVQDCLDYFEQVGSKK